MVWFQKITIPSPQRVIGISEGEGILKAKIFKGMYEPKLGFLEGWGAPIKNPMWGGGYQYLLEHYTLSSWSRNLPKLLIHVHVSQEVINTHLYQ